MLQLPKDLLEGEAKTHLFFSKTQKIVLLKKQLVASTRRFLYFIDLYYFSTGVFLNKQLIWSSPGPRVGV